MRRRACGPGLTRGALPPSTPRWGPDRPPGPCMRFVAGTGDSGGAPSASDDPGRDPGRGPGPSFGPAGGQSPLAEPRRIAALHLPLLPIERRRLTGAAAIWAPEGSRRVLVAVSAEAAAAGLRPGQALADAQAILPEVALHPHAPEADAAWLRRLGHWAHCVTPLPALDPPDGLLLDVAGVAHLHGTEDALRRALAARFARAGLTARIAIAGTAAAAAGLARAGVEIVVPPGEEAVAIAPLPLAALRLPDGTIAALHRLGQRAASAPGCWRCWMRRPAPARSRCGRCGRRRNSSPRRTSWNPSSRARPSTPRWRCCCPTSAGNWPRPAGAPAASCCRPSGWMARCRPSRSAPACRRASRGMSPGCSGTGSNGSSPASASSAWRWRRAPPHRFRPRRRRCRGKAALPRRPGGRRWRSCSTACPSASRSGAPRRAPAIGRNARPGGSGPSRRCRSRPAGPAAARARSGCCGGPCS
ncbi:hypothetical protein CKO45_14755 [Paracraurococcus ruber]|uniref:UmuC domain-containing protein n=1 Tax=Paracraurococcus ruber TaxID=77675 RepID=A0ABS1CYK0_9PROT|nr:hypothetical protein [Paracraurococcus ruber]